MPKKTEKEELETPAGQMASVAAKVTRDLGGRLPGLWDFYQAFIPYMELVCLEERRNENKLSQSTTAAEHGKLLFLFKRGTELEDEIQAAKALIYETEHPSKK